MGVGRALLVAAFLFTVLTAACDTADYFDCAALCGDAYRHCPEPLKKVDECEDECGYATAGAVEKAKPKCQGADDCDDRCTCLDGIYDDPGCGL